MTQVLVNLPHIRLVAYLIKSSKKWQVKTVWYTGVNGSDDANILWFIDHDNSLMWICLSPLYIDMMYVLFIPCNNPDTTGNLGTIRKGQST